MNLLRWRGVWAVLLVGLGLAMPAVAQPGGQLPAPPGPVSKTEAPLEGSAKMPTLLPTPDATPLVPVVPATSSFIDNSPPAEQSDPKAGLWVIDAEYLLMASRRGNQDYAVVGSAPILGPVGVVKSIDGNYDSGLRVGAGYRIPGENMEVMFRYTFLHNDSNQNATQPPGQILFATATHPGLVVQVASANARSSVNLNLFDIELAKRFDISDSMVGRVFVGPRFANIDQKFTATYTGGDVNRDEVRRRLFFDGGGARAGGEVQWKFWDQLGTYFRGSGSLMTGRFRGDLSETANNTSVVNVSEKFNRVIPNMEMGLGLQYQSGGWRLSVGYEFSTFFGMVDGVDFVDDAHPAKIGRQTGNLSFDGIVFRSELAF
jgi:Legionella pneumophila major outer membrane protein precursor